MKMKGLGRGLDALLAGNETAGKEQQRTLPVGSLQPGKYQPRTRMDKESLEELAASIRAQGLMQPILVRPVGNAAGDERYEIVAGERRWRAAQMAGMTEVATLIREIPDESALAMALIENIQRENLNPLEEAQGLQRLIDEFSMTHQQAADAVGRSRPAAYLAAFPSRLTQTCRRREASPSASGSSSMRKALCWAVSPARLPACCAGSISPFTPPTWIRATM